MSLNSRFPAETVIRCDRIRVLREAAGLDRNDLARRASLSVRQLQELEGAPGETFYSHQIKLNAVAKVARVLGAPEDELFEFTGDAVAAETPRVALQRRSLRLQPGAGPQAPPGGASRGVGLSDLLFAFVVVMTVATAIWAATIA